MDTTKGEGDGLVADHGSARAGRRGSPLARDLREGGREGDRGGGKTGFINRRECTGREGGSEGRRLGHPYPLPKRLPACWDILHL